MPYTVDDGAILEVSFRGRSWGQRTISLFHYKYSTTLGPIDGPTLINTIDGLLNLNAPGKLLKNYLICCAAAFTLEEIVYQWVFPTRRARIVKQPVTSAGMVVGTLAPPNLSVALTKRSDVAGRHGHGTLHMPGLTMEGIEGGNLSPLQQEVYGGLLGSLFQTENPSFGSAIIPVIYNRTAPQNSVIITTAESQTTVRTAHRRTVGVGE